ncbi:hypothetical protein DFH94DRAFT_820487 [Russula ochroleuca]|uniref:Uncharacterized protein n=1 Tax=Russula ochroleuca TaxID=152965 RepID=A0A9P5N1U3_9AGAM|nr:hypothetical protein DFH94DRAFT_820487 [Russula ochroleuca]
MSISFSESSTCVGTPDSSFLLAPIPLPVSALCSTIPGPLYSSPDSSSLLFPMDTEIALFDEDMRPHSSLSIDSCASSVSSTADYLRAHNMPLPILVPLMPNEEDNNRCLYHFNISQAGLVGTTRASFGDTDQKAEEDADDEWPDEITDNAPSPPPSSPTTSRSLLPSYKSDNDFPGHPWVRNTRATRYKMEPFLIPIPGIGLRETKYVKYDLTPSYPKAHFTMGKGEPSYSCLLRPACAPRSARPYTKVQHCLFNHTEPFLDWVEDALEIKHDPSLSAGVYNYRHYCKQSAVIEAKINKISLHSCPILEA